MTDVKDRLIANNNTINWIPESIGKGRFGDWLKTFRIGAFQETDIGVLR